MGELTRSYDWAQTSLGSPDQWPQSVRTAVSIVLNSRFPMFLFWGPDLICFYNDAFRPSLGNEGKHPWALGKMGKDVWEEIWPTIKPWIDQVLGGGEAIWMEDQLVGFYRNGQMEDIYWTFSYSPVCDERGTPAGVFVTCTETTDKVVSFQRLKAANKQFENLVMHAPVAIAVFRGPDFIAEIVNDAYLPLVSKSREEFVGKPLFDSLPEIRAALEPLAREVVRTGKAFCSNEWEVLMRRNGKEELCYFNFIWEPVRNIDGVIDGFVAVGHEITGHVRARKKIEESEARFHLLADSMPQFVWTANAQGKLDYFNKSVFEYTGLKQEELEGDGWLQVVHPDEQEEDMRRWTQAVATGADYIVRHRFRSSGGEYRWQLTRAVPFRNDKGEIVLWIGTSTDIHEQKLFEEELNRQVQERTHELEGAKEQLQQANTYLQQIINNFESALAVLVPVYVGERIVDFTFKMINTAYSQYAHLSPGVMQHRRVSEVFPGYYQTDAFDRYVETFETGKHHAWDLHYNQDGLDVYLQVVASRMGDDLVVHFTDYTELKSLQIDLMRKIEELQRSNTNLEEFAYAASHDLKEPIRKIHFFADKLRHDLEAKLSTQQVHLFNRLDTSTGRMQSLVDDLLSYSQVSIRPRVLEAVNLGDLVRFALTDLELAIEEKKAVINIGELPVVQGHVRQLQQLFQNLLSNALKYSKPGTTPVIDITSQKIKGFESEYPLSSELKNKDYYQVEVADNGIGFDQQHAEKIFQVFQRLHGNAEYKGTGVGLAIARKVAENHGGFLWARGEMDKGARFVLLLPAD